MSSPLILIISIGTVASILAGWWSCMAINVLRFALSVAVNTKETATSTTHKGQRYAMNPSAKGN